MSAPSTPGTSGAGDRFGALFGEHTATAFRNFAVPGPRLRDFPGLIHAVALVKVAAARVNRALRQLDPQISDAIAVAGQEVRNGVHDAQFLLPIVQGGGGTSTNMSVNEVLANRATQVLHEQGTTVSVHPNDHVNRSQSTNDVMPTAIGLAVWEAIGVTFSSLRHLVGTLEAKAAEYSDLEHLGRTCLQDAVALPVGALHRSHAYGIEQAASALQTSGRSLLAVPLGSTAVGTGVGAPAEFGRLAVAELAELSGHPIAVAENPYYALASLEPLVAVSEAVDRCARSAARVASDLRLLASGPVGGIGEVRLPEVQAGSSIMPGKVNPVIPELMIQTSFQCAGEANSARLAAGAGELEVSAMAPVVTLGLLAGLHRLSSAADLLADRCIAETRWDEAAVRANLEGSLSEAVIAATVEGYEAVASRVRPVGDAAVRNGTRRPSTT